MFCGELQCLFNIFFSLLIIFPNLFAEIRFPFIQNVSIYIRETATHEI